MTTDDAAHAPSTLPHAGVSTPGLDAAGRSITRTKVTPPAPVADADQAPSFRERVRRSRRRPDLAAALEPFPGPNILRLVMTTLLAMLCLLTVGGAILLLLLWQQNEDSGVLTSQIDRTWEFFGYLQDVERWVAVLTVPVAVAWIALATLNVGRATGHIRSIAFAALSLPVGIAGVWFTGAEVVAVADDTTGKAAGMILQAVFLAIPLLALERVVEAADARHRPLRVAYLAGVAFLVQLQGLGGLSTTEVTRDADRWGRLGADLVIGALIMVVGALAANEAARAIEEATDHRYQLRHRFGEALLSSAGVR